jgi:hypothetical protein
VSLGEHEESFNISNGTGYRKRKRFKERVHEILFLTTVTMEELKGAIS